jgi:nucleoside 2-deoxyribosyltransferase
MYIAYLAGPITGLSFDGAVDWREFFINALSPEIQGMSPLRGKDYLQNSGEIAPVYPSIPLSCSRGIMTRDFNDCKRCDILVVNFLGAKKISIGTVMELAWAYAFRIPTIVIIEKEGNPHDHPMVQEAIGYRVTSIEEAVVLTKSVLLPISHHKPIKE